MEAQAVNRYFLPGAEPKSGWVLVNTVHSDEGLIPLAIFWQLRIT